MGEARRFLDENGYVLLQGMGNAPLTASLHRYILKRAEDRNLKNDDQVPGAASAYGDPVMEKLLEGFVPDMERVTGRPLHPTYAYFRLYHQGDELKAHTDRAACEVPPFHCAVEGSALDPWHRFTCAALTAFSPPP